MVASRYQGSFGYAPRMASGAYPGGGPRNALAPVYSAPPVGSVGAPVGGMPTGGMAAPMAPAAPSLTSGTGALSGAPRVGGDGVGFGDPGGEYGGPGPQGAPGTGNLFDDARNFADVAAPAMAGLLGGPMGIAGLTVGVLGAGALRGLGYERAANAVVGNIIGAPTVDVMSEWGNPGTAQTPEGGNFGAGANTAGGDLSSPSMESTIDDSALMGSYGSAPAGVTSMDGITGDPTGGLGNPGGGEVGSGNFGDGANSDSGGGMNSGGESNTSDGSAGLGSSGTWRYGGYTGHGEDGTVDPYAEAGTVHEGEYVLRHEATRHYGPELLHMLNSGAVPLNALMGIAMAQRPQAANHLLQMMMR